MVFLKECFKKVDFGKKSTDHKKMKKYPVGKELNHFLCMFDQYQNLMSWPFFPFFSFSLYSFHIPSVIKLCARKITKCNMLELGPEHEIFKCVNIIPNA